MTVKKLTAAVNGAILSRIARERDGQRKMEREREKERERACKWDREREREKACKWEIERGIVTIQDS